MSRLWVALVFFVLFFGGSFAVSSASFIVDPLGVFVGGQGVDSNSFQNVVAVEQGFVGDLNSPSFHTEVGFIFALYADGTPPIIVSFSPSVDTTTAESAPQFSVVVQDFESGLQFCSVKLFRNNVLVLDENVLPSNGYYGQCVASVSLPNDFDFAKADWVVFDNAGSSVAVSSGQLVKSSAGVTPPIGGGGGAGSFCFSSLQCLVGLFCVNGFCLLPDSFILSDLNSLSVNPDFFDLGQLSLDSSAGSSFSLSVDVFNNGYYVLPVDSFFDCHNDYNCAKDWCSLRGEKSFVLNPFSKRKVFFDCTVPEAVLVGSVFETGLVFQAPSFAEKIVSIRIPVKQPKGSYAVVSPTSATPLANFVPLLLPNLFGLYSLVKGFFGVDVGFGIIALSLNDLLIVVLIVLNLIAFLRAKERNDVLLVALLAACSLKLVFGVF